MVDFIVHERNIELKNCYEMIILNFIGHRDEKFKIYEYDNYINTNSRSIYILSSENFKEVLNIAKTIRENNDWYSQIVIISNFDHINADVLNNKLLILDYISFKDNIKEKLKETLYRAYSIVNNDETLNFLLNSEVHKIPYRNILYIEKGNNQNYCTINTEEDEFIIKDTINNLEEILDSAFFMKTHRSCIVNLSKIKCYNCSDNMIYFDNKNVDLVAREKKQILKSKLLNEMVKE